MEQNKGNAWALLPIAVFLVIYIGVSIIFNDFYLMSVAVARAVVWLHCWHSSLAPLALNTFTWAKPVRA